MKRVLPQSAQHRVHNSCRSYKLRLYAGTVVLPFIVRGHIDRTVPIQRCYDPKDAMTRGYMNVCEAVH